MSSDPESKQGDRMLAAVKAGNLEAVQKFDVDGVSLDYRDEYGRHALMHAVRRGNLDLVQYCIDKCELEAKTKSGRTALAYAVLEGHDFIATTLIEKGADVNTADENGYTPLMIAVNKGSEKLVLALLTAGADQTIADKSGKRARDFTKNERLLNALVRFHKA